MKLRSMAMVMFGVGALAAAGCSKKPKEGKAPDVGSASNTMGSAGSGSAAAQPPKEARREGKAMAEHYLACTEHINGGKWDDFKTNCLTADYKGHQADGESLAGADAVVDMFKAQRTAFPDMKFQPQVVLVNGRNILAVGLVTGTHTGVLKSPMGEVPATNKKIGQLMFHRLVINDENRAAEEWAYYDPATMASQLGLMPKDAPPMRPAMDKGMDGAPIIVVAADDDKEKKNLEAATKATAAFTSHKVPDILATYTDDALESDQAGSKDWKGKKEIQAGTEMLFKAFPDFKGSEATYFAAGDYVVLLGKFEGTHTGPLGPMKATNKKVSGEFAEIMEIKDGKVAKLWRFRNGMAMAAQLGLMGPPPGAGSAAPPAGGGSGSAAPKGDAPKGDAPKKDEKKG